MTNQDKLDLRLGEIATFTKGKNVQLSSHGSIVIGASEISGNLGQNFSVEPGVEVKKNDLVMLWDGERSGLVATGLEGVAGSTVSRLRVARPDLIDSKFFYYLLAAQFSWIQFHRTGTGVPHVPSDLASRLEFSFPSIDKQKRIAEILSAVDEQIESLSIESSKQELVFRGLLINYFPILDGGLAPSGWRFKKIRELGEVITGNTPATNIPENYGGGHAFVSPGDISKEMFINKTEKSLTDRGFAGCRKLPKDAILTVCIGSTIGKIAIAGVPCATNQQINAIIPTNIELSHFYYFSLLSCLERQLGKYVGLQAVPIINKSNFSEIEILVPESSQDCIPIMKALKGCLNSLEVLNDKAAKLKELKKSLMDDLLTGKTRVPS